jgi:RNA polymerase sigma factor (sigma-70 family)
VEASALQAQAVLARNRSGLGVSLLRLRSDEQLVELFRSGHDEAFRTIHDRYRQRLFAYTRQMLPGARADAEDALQDVFVRAYSGLRANDRELTLRAWLYRVAHNRCVDELRRPIPPAPEVLGILRSPTRDPVVEAEQRDSLRQLVRDVRELPEQQRSALLMRELAGMPYTDIAGALGTSVAAVKSLLVRARVGLAQAAEARDTACAEIREELVLAHDRGVRASGLARRHMHECSSCRAFRTEIRGVSRKFAAMVAPIGPVGMVAHLLGFGGGGGAAAAGGGAGAGAGTAGAGAAGAGAAGAGAAAAGGGVATAGASFVAVGHVATLLAAAVVTAGGAVELQRTLSAPVRHAHVARHASPAPPATPVSSPAASAPTGAATGAIYPAAAGIAHSAAASTHSAGAKESKTVPARDRASGSVSEVSSTATASTSASGGSGLGDGSASGSATGVSTTTGTGTGAPIPLPGSTESVPSGDDTSPGTSTGDSTGTPDGTSDGTPSSPAVSTTSDPNATTSSAVGPSGSPTTSGSAGTSSNTVSGSSGSGGSGSNWPL